MRSKFIAIFIGLISLSILAAPAAQASYLDTQIKTLSILSQFEAKNLLVSTLMESAQDNWVDLGTLTADYENAQKKVQIARSLMVENKYDDAYRLSLDIKDWMLQIDTNTLRDLAKGNADVQIAIAELKANEARLNRLIEIAESNQVDAEEIRKAATVITEHRTVLEEGIQKGVSDDEMQTLLRDILKSDGRSLVNYYIENRLVVQYLKKIKHLEYFLKKMSHVAGNVRLKGVDTSTLDQAIETSQTALDRATVVLKNHGNLNEITRLTESILKMDWRGILAEIYTKLYADDLDLSTLTDLPSAYYADLSVEHAEKLRSLIQSLSADEVNDFVRFALELSPEVLQSFLVIIQEAPTTFGRLKTILLRLPTEHQMRFLVSRELQHELIGKIEAHLDELSTTPNIHNRLTAILETLKEKNIAGAPLTRLTNAVDNFIAESRVASNRFEIIRPLSNLEIALEGEIKNAITEKFNDGLIAFKDVDDSEWYSEFVEFAKARKIISGYQDAAGNDLGEYRPALAVTVAEAVKMITIVTDLPVASGVPTNTFAANHWAKGYIKTAEEHGLSFIKKTTDIDRPATRAQVVRAILEALNIAPATSVTSLSDLAGHPDALYIQKAVDLGIVSGNPDGTFRPDEFVNRAEMAKIVRNAAYEF